MIQIINIGMNHETAPVELRECLAKEASDSMGALALMRESKNIREGLFLSTCNRVEAIFTAENSEEAKADMVSILARLGSIPEESFVKNLYTLEGMDAVTHIFRVASSLDSMVVGEPQILGQIKESYSLAATKEKTSGVILNRLMHKAFHVAKRVRTETGVSESAVSISYAAVELAKKIFYDLEDKGILLIGAGEMAELAARHLMGQGIKNMVVANRSFDRAVQVAESFNGKPVFFEEIEEELLDADIVIASTGSTEYVIRHEQVKRSLKKRRNRSLFFIDIAVPRDIEPKVNELGNVYVYDIDDLKEVVEENSSQRRQEAIKAERIIKQEVMNFEKWVRTLDVVPTIISLKEKIEDIRKRELEKSLAGLGKLTPSQTKCIENLSISITEKIINDPILVLKGKTNRSSMNSYLDITRKLFNLDQDKKRKK
ncbi:glutamyl-tRNA reductase [Thermodesulfobacteriota bacterium]